MSKTTYRIPESVIEDTRTYRHEVEKFLAGDISAVAFRAIRVPMGIYEQRENDTYMVRVRGAAGVFFPHQLRTIADLSDEFGNGIVHVTTRQDLQIHRVLAENTPAVLERLLESGLSSRGGGGNTVRNVSACPSAGACADEVFDVTPYAMALTEYLISNRANFNLPRKFKSAFSGCSRDCGLASVADVGLFAHIRDGRRGFSVYAGGGMGASSALGIRIEEFIPAESIFEIAEAVKRLFDKYGDRANRHKARLRFVVERFGEDEFRRLYREELEGVRREEIAVPSISVQESEAAPISAIAAEEPSNNGYAVWKVGNAIAQKQEGLFMVRIPLPLGDLSADALRRIADMVEAIDGADVRTTQGQDLLLRNIPADKLPAVYRSLAETEEAFVSSGKVKCVACAGASTCKLGLCLSRGLASAIQAELSDIRIPFESPIRISGCPNSCGHHPIAPIGLSGGAVRSDGRLAPFYWINVGGHLSEGDSALSKPVGKVPAKAVPALLREFWIEVASQLQDGESLQGLLDRWGIEYLHSLVGKYGQVPSYDIAPEYYRDFGSNEDFSLAGRGPGECGAGVMDVIALDIEEAKRAFAENRLYDTIVVSARSLLVTRGLEPKKDREIFAAFTDHLITPGWIDPKAQSILDAAVDHKLGDRDSLDDMVSNIQSLLNRVEELYRSLDSNLSFRVDKFDPLKSPESAEVAAPLHEVDLRGVSCPMNFVRAKIELENLDAGEVLDVLLDDGEPARNVPASFADQGQEVLSVDSEGSHFRVRIRKT